MDCYFCKKNLQKIDWQNVGLLRRFITGLGKIKRKDATELCAKHQRMVSKAVKRARNFGLLSPTSKY